METKVDTERQILFEGRPVSQLGLRLRQIRTQIQAAAERGETKLLSEQELEHELSDLRHDDPDVP
jgi:hypothetical protein